jgi:CheY-like chemotaxis protein
MSALGRLRDLDRYRSFGATAGLVKPVIQSELFRVLEALHPVAANRPAVLRPAVPSTNGRRLLVLAAEDNPINQRLAAKLLEKLGHAVTLAANGREAVDAWRAGRFDVILMDVQMPEVDGFEATAVIRDAECGRDTHIPIVAMTAHAMTGDRERCLAAGMNDYVAKPISVKEIDRVLAHVADSCGISTLDTVGR